MIITKYETPHDKEEELRLGELFHQCYMPECDVVNLGFLSPFDFEVRKNGELLYYLEVKVKNGPFSTYEMIPENKWTFLESCPQVCYMLIEREGLGRLFNMTRILESKRFYPREIKRREDQPGGSKKVIMFFSDTGTDIYYPS